MSWNQRQNPSGYGTPFSQSQGQGGFNPQQTYSQFPSSGQGQGFQSQTRTPQGTIQASPSGQTASSNPPVRQASQAAQTPAQLTSEHLRLLQQLQQLVNNRYLEHQVQ